MSSTFVKFGQKRNTNINNNNKDKPTQLSLVNDKDLDSTIKFRNNIINIKNFYIKFFYIINNNFYY